jgi:hypothetical protein
MARLDRDDTPDGTQGDTPAEDDDMPVAPAAGVSIHPLTRQMVEEAKAKHRATDRAARAKRESVN